MLRTRFTKERLAITIALNIAKSRVKTKYRLNFWHTNNWPVDTNPASIEKPLYPYELETDWMSYIPFN